VGVKILRVSNQVICRGAIVWTKLSITHFLRCAMA